MNRRKHRLDWVTRSLLVFSALFLVVVLLPPILIDLEVVKKNILAKISSYTGGPITYRNLNISYFPRPHVVIQDADISIPDRVTLKTRLMRIYPRILPLFRGRLQFAAISLDEVDSVVNLPQMKDAKTRRPDQTPSLDDRIRAFNRGVRSLPGFRLPGTRLKIENSRVSLIDPLGQRFMLKDVQAAYVPKRDQFDFSITGQSTLWEKIEIHGSLDPSNFAGEGRVNLSRFRPEKLISYLFPNSPIQVNKTRADVTIDFTSADAGGLKAEINGTVPICEFVRGKEKLAIKGGRLKGTLSVDEKMTRFELTDFGMDHPGLNLTGTFAYDEERPDVLVFLEGSKIDAGSLRQAALQMAGERRFIQDLFDVIRGGHIPQMTVRMQGQTTAQLSNPDNLVLEGRMTRGKLYIPKSGLDLEDVFGDVVIAGGVLRGEKLKARLGNSIGQDGSLVMDLNKNSETFHLDIEIQADLSQLPPVLNRVVPNTDFLSELARVKDVTGLATGRLVLGDNLTDLAARVAVSEAQFSMYYTRIPYPIQMAGSHFVCEGTRIDAKRFNVEIGSSSFTEVAATIDWGKTPSLDARIRAARVDAGQFHTWLMSFGKIKKKWADIRSVTGDIMAHDVHISGPMGEPNKWDYGLKATVKQITVSSDELVDPLIINTGSIAVATDSSGEEKRRKVDVKKANLSWENNHLLLSGKIGFSKKDILLTMDAQADNLAWDQINRLLKYRAKKKPKPVPGEKPVKLTGTIRIKSERLFFKSYTVVPLEAEIVFEPDRVAVSIERADMCGISLAGRLNFLDQVLEVNLLPTAADRELASTLSCLSAKKGQATGTYNLSGEIDANAKPEAINRSLTGSLAFSAEKGRIYRFGLLAKLLSILNITEIYRGEVPDLSGEGFAYHRMSARAKLKGDRIVLEACTIDGASMGIACEGEINLVDKKMNVLILIAPFKTLDRVVKILPLIGGVLGGKLISIPFRATGDLNNPDIYALHPNDVGSGILGILERTLKLPVTIIQPLITSIQESGWKPGPLPEEPDH